MSRRRGFALIAVLWTVTALAGVVGFAVGAARLGQQTSLNRLALTRGRWAAEACLAIAQARWVQNRLADTTTEDLGRGTHCAWELTDPTARLNVNEADPTELAALLCPGRAGGCPVDSLVARRRAQPFADLAEVAGVPGVDTTALPLLTVDGPGSVNANTAAPAVLLALPGFTPEAIARITESRAVGRPIASLDALAGAVSSAARAPLLAHYADLSRELTFAAPVYLLTTRGWVEGIGARDRLVAVTELMVVPVPDRLAIVRRRLA